MNIFPFKAIVSRSEMIASEESFFGTVKYEYPNYFKNGFFKEAIKPGIYIYLIETSHGHHRGLVANNALSDIADGKILKHENTLSAKEQKMMNVMLQNQAMVKPVLLAYERVPQLEKLFDEIIESRASSHQVHFKELGEVHTLWQISDENEIEKVQKIFAKKIDKVYIADGHHRMATTLKMHENGFEDRINHVLSIYMAFSELSIYDYNRVVDISELIDEVRFIAEISRYCHIKPIKRGRKSTQKNEIIMYLHHGWYRLRWKKSILAKYRKNGIYFDSGLLNHIILGKILGIENIRTNPRISYVSGVDGLESLKDKTMSSAHNVAFCLYPISDKEIRFVADNGLTLPPKSTWFEPRIKNGMLVYPF